MKKLLFLLTLVIVAGLTACNDPNSSTDGPKEPTPTITSITFDANGGTGGQTATVNATVGQPMPALTAAQPPTKSGEHFTGYWDAKTGGTQYYKQDLTSARSWDKDTIEYKLCAQWSIIPLTTITFNANGGTGTMENQQIKAGDSASLTANAFTRTGYTFAGWNTKNDGSETSYTDEESYTAGATTASVILYAKWTPKTYTVSFDNTGGTGGQTATVTATFDQPMPAISAVPTPSTAEYIFTGYYDAQTGGKMYYNTDKSSASNWDKDANATLYARFASLSKTPAPQSVVSLVQSETVTQASNFTYEEILKMTRDAIDLAGGLNDIVHSGDVVVLKPNVICTVYNWGSNEADNLNTHIPELVNGVCTDKRVVQAVAQIVREIIGTYDSTTGRSKIMVIEGPGKSSQTGTTWHHFRNIGYTDINGNSLIPNVDQVILLDQEGGAYSAGQGENHTAYVTQLTLPGFVYNGAENNYLTYYKNDGKYWVNKKMLEADALICLPVVKSHWNATVTGAIKNIGIGAAPPKIYGNGLNDGGRNNMVNHSSTLLQDWIVDYFSCLPADFVVMDGLQGLQNGPLPGGQGETNALTPNQKNLRSILASKDALAIDTVAANIIGWDYTTIPYMTKLNTKGEVYARGEIGKSNPRKIILRGNPKDIVVLGNKKVDDVDVRGDYNSNNQDPGNPGKKLTAAQKTPPTLSINSAAFSGTNLDLKLTLSSGENNAVVKIDVYVDNAYKGSFNTDTGMLGISLDVSDLAAGSHNIEVRAFTKYLFCDTTTTTATK
jgi:uncharacterized repeat protein (TIGR02543 family)